jgi:hydroxymethylglutaryl-CoA lyase
MKSPANQVKLIECPRDAMQGLKDFIPTKDKARYINSLLKTGFDTIDFGSFVSAAAIPQLRDTAEVLHQLELNATTSKLLAIVANTRGAREALTFEQISFLGFPLSLSETFQQKNTNKSIAEAFQTVQEIQELCKKNKATLVVYLSMGFGNPYGDIYNAGYLQDFTYRLDQLKIEIVCPSDTIGISNPANIELLFRALIPAFPHIEFGAHLHAAPDQAEEKVQAAYRAGCRRFDGAIRGYGGCPMAEDVLVGNIATEKTVQLFEEHHIATGIDKEYFGRSLKLASEIFPVG